jgi:hypothetical protein
MMEEKRRVDKSGSAYEATDPDVVPSDEATMLRDAPYVAKRIKMSTRGGGGE